MLTEQEKIRFLWRTSAIYDQLGLLRRPIPLKDSGWCSHAVIIACARVNLPNPYANISIQFTFLVLPVLSQFVLRAAIHVPQHDFVLFSTLTIAFRQVRTEQRKQLKASKVWYADATSYDRWD